MSGQPDEVVEACTAIIDAGEEPPEHLSIALSNRGVAYERRGEFDKAISDHTKALELAPDATIFLNRGSAYSKKGDAEAAIADFSRSIELRPEDAAAYLYRGKERLLSGDAQQARGDLDRGLGLVNDRDPETVGTLNMLVREFYGAKRYEEAIPFAQKVLAIRNATLGPEHAETLAVLHTLASLDWYARKYAEAEPLLKQLAATREKVLGPDDPETAASLNELGTLYWSTGSYSQAEPYFQRALAIREKALGPEDVATADSLNGLAVVYWKAGRYAEAEPLFQRALAIRQKSLGPEHPDTAATVNNLAGLYWNMSAYAQAEPLMKRALAIDEKIYGSEDPEIVTNLINLGALYESTGEYGQAEAHFKRAVAITEKALGPDDPRTATSLNGLAAFYRETGAYTLAEPLLKRALAIRERAFGTEHPETAESLNNLGVLYYAMKAFPQAEALLEQGLAVRQKILGAESLEAAESLGNLGNLYDHTGDFARAEALLQKALAIREKVLGPEHPDTAQALDSLAGHYTDIRSYAQAEPLLTRALAIREKALGKDHPATATSLASLANLYEAAGAFAKAESLDQRALAIRERSLGPEHPDTATVLNNLGALYLEQGSYDRAGPPLERALAIDQKVFGQDHPATIDSLNNLAELYQETGAYAKAEALFQRAVAIGDKAFGPGDPDAPGRLDNIGVLEWAQSQWPEAAGTLRRAAQRYEVLAQNVLMLGDESRKRAFAASMDDETAALVTFSLTARDMLPDAVAIGLEPVLQRKGRVLDLMADSFGAVRGSLAPEDRRLLDQWREAAAQSAALRFRGPEKLPAAEYRRELEQLQSKGDAIEAELAQRSAEFRRKIETVTVARVQQAIPDGAVLVEWLRYRPFVTNATRPQDRYEAPHYMAYVLKHQGPPAAVYIGEAKAIDTATSDLLAALRDPRSSVVRELGRDLDARLLRPLRPYLGDARQVILSPDGQLNLLPFGVLIDEQGRYFVERTEITYVTSGRDLLRTARAGARRGPPVIVADPDFGSAAEASSGAQPAAAAQPSADPAVHGLRFSRLEGTAGEADAIGRILKGDGAQVLTKGSATEEAVKHLHSPRILHLATHGFFLPDPAGPAPAKRLSTTEARLGHESADNPLLRSGLALAGANQLRSGAEDGILTALEVAGLDLTGTELVTLSACETGVGTVQNGEGVYGLRRAFVLAGAETQVASLWKVDDDATRDLMVDYYSRLNAGAGRSAALRAAQLAMLGDNRRRHPYYWASFIVVGDGGPLTSR